MKKRVVVLLSTIFMMLFMSQSVFASSLSPTEKVSAEVGMSKPVKPGQITPFTTVTGPAGTARLDYLSTAGEFTWSVKPTFSTVFHFSGTITVISSETGMFIASFPVSGFGALGGSVSGDVPYYLPRGAGITATLNGVASDLDGVQSVVLPGCSVFAYRP